MDLLDSIEEEDEVEAQQEEDMGVEEGDVKQESVDDGEAGGEVADILKYYDCY